jgi:RHS repeat-associated protein
MCYARSHLLTLIAKYRYTTPQDATGLYYYNARYYDPQLGTFISPDTLVPDSTSVADFNRYAYARLNPLKYNDPTGHWAELAIGCCPVTSHLFA